MYANKVKLGQKTLENLVFKKKRASNFSPKQHATVDVAPNQSSMSKFAAFAGDMNQDEPRNITTGDSSVDHKLTGNNSNSRQEPAIRGKENGAAYETTGGYSVTSQSRRPIRDAIFHPDHIDIKGIPKVSDSVWKRHNHDTTASMGSVNQQSAKYSTLGGMTIPISEDDKEAVESWNQLQEFDNRVTR